MATYQSRFHKLNMKQLRVEVGKLTTELNINLMEYRETGKTEPVFESVLERLQAKGGAPRKTKTFKGFVGKGSRLNKAELIEYAEDLQRMISWDTFTPKGKKKRQEAEEKAWKTFRKTHPTWTREQYENALSILPKLKDLMDENYAELLEMYKEASAKGVEKEEFESLLQQVYDSSTGQSLTAEDVIDKLRYKVDEAITNKYIENMS